MAAATPNRPPPKISRDVGSSSDAATESGTPMENSGHEIAASAQKNWARKMAGWMVITGVLGADSGSKETATMAQKNGRGKCLLRKCLLGRVSEEVLTVARGRDFSLPGFGSMVREFGNIRAGMCTILLTKSRAGLIVFFLNFQFNPLDFRFPGEGL
jgi:hypothetical protein